MQRRVVSAREDSDEENQNPIYSPLTGRRFEILDHFMEHGVMNFYSKLDDEYF